MNRRSAAQILCSLAVATSLASAHAQTGPKLVGITEICMGTPGLTPFPSFLALDDTGQLYVHSTSPLAPVEMTSAWLPYDHLPPGTPTSITVRDNLAPHATHRLLVTMENGDVYSTPGSTCITFGNPIGFQHLGNVFTIVPVRAEPRTWGQVRGTYRK